MYAVDVSLPRFLSEILGFAEWGGAILAIVGALVMSMNRRWSWYAWPLWILSNLLLLIPATQRQLWGFAAMQSVFLVLNVNGLLRCRRPPPKPSGRMTTWEVRGNGQ